MDLLNEFKALIGSKIHFRTTAGEYEGMVKSVSFEKKQVTVKHIYSFPQNLCIGNSTFFFYEFLSYNVLSSFNSDTEVKKNRLFFDSKRNFSKNNCHTNYSFKEFSSKLKPKQCFAVVDSHSTEFVLKLPPNLQHLLSSDSVIIDSIDLEFKCATNHISKQSVIGVSFHGFKISRIGNLIWICISTKYCVFLFDIQALGKDAFDKGLRNIFQCQNTVKVIHGCQGPFDYLFHLFSTILDNVFDTQIADFIVNKQKGERNSSLINVTLDKCLVNYLAVPNEFLYINKKFSPCVKKSICINKRPIDNESRNILIKDTLYLIILREKLIKLMLKPVYEVSNFYLKVLRESPASTSEIWAPSFIPSALLAQGIEIVTIQKDSVKTSVTSMKSERSHSSQRTNGSGRNSPIKDTCKTKTQNPDYFFNKNISSVSLRQKCERKSESKRSTNVDNQAISDTIANGIAQKCSVVSTKFIRCKNPDTNCLKKTLNRISSEKSRNPAVTPSEDTVSKSDVIGPHSKRSTGNKPLTKISETDVKDSSKCNSQKELRNMSERSNFTNGNISDYSETWAKLRSAVDASHDVSEWSVRNSKKDFKIVPSGMGC